MKVCLPHLSESELPVEREALLEALAEQWDEADGYALVELADIDLLLFVRQGKIWCAGAVDGDRAYSVPLNLAMARFPGKAARFYETDLPLFLCLAVMFRKAPSAQIPAHLVDADQILASVRETGKDAVLVLQRGASRSVAFCRGGEPAALYAAPGEAFAAEGSIADRIVEYVYAGPDQAEVSLLLYDEIRLPPAADAASLRELIEAGATLPPTTTAEPPMLVVRLGGRVVFHYPVNRPEVLVGRSEKADLELDNLSVSREHVKIRTTADGLVAEDLGSENGIVVDGERKKRVVLRPGVKIEVGKYTLELGEGDDSDLTAPAILRSRAPGVSAEKTISLDQVGGRARVELDGESHKVVGPIYSIGTGKRANLRVKGFLLGEVHSVIRRGDGGFIAEQRGGLRPLRVNGQSTRRQVLHDGDEIAIGNNRLTFHVEED